MTGREVCHSVKDGKFPAKCDDKFCKPKNKPATKKKSGGGACAMSLMAGSGDGSRSEPESWSCATCDPASDPDCAYDTACGCKARDADDANPECSEDLVCESPTPTPSPTESPTPDPTVIPTPFPTVTPYMRSFGKF